MSKCGKGCLPECEYFTTGGGCASPVNCLYKVEGIYSNSATSNSNIFVVFEPYRKTNSRKFSFLRAD